MSDKNIKIIVPVEREIDKVQESDYIKFMANPYWCSYPNMKKEYKTRYLGKINKFILEDESPIVIKTGFEKSEAKHSLKQIRMHNPRGLRYLLVTEDEEYVADFLKRFKAGHIDVMGATLDLFGKEMGNVGGWADYLESRLNGTEIKIDTENSLCRYEPNRP